MSFPKVSIVVPTYRVNSKPYLDLCIKAVENLDYPKDKLEVIISSHANYIPKYRIAKNVLHPNCERNFSEAVNFGIDNASPDSEHIFLLSDDTVPTRDSLKNLVQTAGDEEVLVGATSNCDRDWKYQLHFLIQKDGELLSIQNRFFTIEQLNGLENELMHAKSVYTNGLIYTDLLCFYALLIPKKVWNKIGKLDEKFQTGYEDSDYCKRAGDLGVKCVIELSALIWHFGGVTTNETGSPEIAEKNKNYLFEKWK